MGSVEGKLTLENRISLLEQNFASLAVKTDAHTEQLGKITGELKAYQENTNTTLDKIQQQIKEDMAKLRADVQAYGKESAEGIDRLYRQFGFDKDPNMGYNFQQMVKTHQESARINEEDKRYYKRLIIGTVVVAVIMASFSVAGIAYNAYNNGQTAKVVRDMKEEK